MRMREVGLLLKSATPKVSFTWEVRTGKIRGSSIELFINHALEFMDILFLARQVKYAVLPALVCGVSTTRASGTKVLLNLTDRITHDEPPETVTTPPLATE